MNNMKVSILIPTLANEKSLPYLEKCIKTIRETQSVAHDIKVMINGGVMKQPKLPAAFYFTKGQGQCQAVNKASKEANTEWLLVTNDDQVFPPNWERMFEDEILAKSDVICMNSMESGKIGAAPPFVVNDCGRDLESFNHEKFNKDAVDLGSGEGSRPDHLEKGFNLPFLVKKELWDKIGGYDESYDPWGSNSDSDLYYKFKLAGVQPYRDRRILNYHFSQISGTFDFMNQARELWDAETKLKEEYWNKNTRYFQEKWGFVRARSPEIWFEINIPKENKYHPEWEKK